MNKESNDLFLLRTDFPDPAITPNQSRMHTTTSLDWGPSGQHNATQSKSKKTGTRDWGVKPKENEFMGQPETRREGPGFRQMFVSWRGTDNWEKMDAEHLFFSPRALGIENDHTQGRLWETDAGLGSESPTRMGVPVELLCWPLDPEALYETVRPHGDGHETVTVPQFEAVRPHRLWKQHRDAVLGVELDPGSSGMYRLMSPVAGKQPPKPAWSRSRSSTVLAAGRSPLPSVSAMQSLLTRQEVVRGQTRGGGAAAPGPSAAAAVLPSADSAVRPRSLLPRAALLLRQVRPSSATASSPSLSPVLWLYKCSLVMCAQILLHNLALTDCLCL
jgi:hypothetical protein